MCGIFGYIGPKKAAKLVLEGLKKLEYRGYDSAGIAGVSDGKILFAKEVGKIASLEKELEKKPIDTHLAIAQTRWATHGQPSKVNAHPHLDQNESLAVIHNGIIENYESLRETLEHEGIKFLSDTDTEVVAHLVAKFYDGDLLKAVQHALPLMKGAFALAMIHKNHPDEIIAVGHEAPLVVGIGHGEMFLASDPQALVSHTKEVIYLSHGEIAVLRKNKLEIFDRNSEKVAKQAEQLDFDAEEVSKGEFQHYTLKEIFEQPSSLRSALLSRFLDEYGTAVFDTLTFDVSQLLSVERVLLLGCGTSWHAGFAGSLLFEDIARIPAQVEISSEYRYKHPVLPSGTLVIAISQSGETADTLAAVRELKAKGSKILGVCNVTGSSLAREADGTLFLRAGPEIGVCSTKAFTSQVTVLALLVLLMARMRHMSKHQGQDFLNALKKLPEQVAQILYNAPKIEAIAKKYAKYENFFFVGRQYMYPTCLEGALKLKEISYINASGYPAGELKHGPIALINENTPTVALLGNKDTYDKMLSNLAEIKARKGPIIAIAEEGSNQIEGKADDLITIPSTMDPLSPILSSVVCQLLAYYIARERGCDIDQPRNLAKSVTVE
jgi:glucosamine--fructose-6-phosphate aminotransferase (isomerizing)